jgi:hypothetical protein
LCGTPLASGSYREGTGVIYDHFGIYNEYGCLHAGTKEAHIRGGLGSSFVKVATLKLNVRDLAACNTRRANVGVPAFILTTQVVVAA